MLLICAFGVSNLGKKWDANEKEEMYSWFSKALKEAQSYSDDTIVVTDTSALLMNQLDEHSPSNKKLLCTWYVIQNMNKHTIVKAFTNSVNLKNVKDNVFVMINCSTSNST